MAARGAAKVPPMPLEGHYQRQTTPLYKLSPREIKAATAVLVVTVVALLAVVIATAGDSSPPTPQGCIRVTVAGIVGAETISGCGADAEEKCAHAAAFEGPRSEKILAECEQQGVRF
jgi:hypothetical protein